MQIKEKVRHADSPEKALTIPKLPKYLRQRYQDSCLHRNLTNLKQHLGPAACTSPLSLLWVESAQIMNGRIKPHHEQGSLAFLSQGRILVLLS